MGYSIVPTVATGDTMTAANWNQYVRDNFAAGVPDIFTAAGDLVYGSAADVAARLGIGSTGKVLRVSSGGLPAWEDGALLRGRASRSAPQSIPSATLTAVQFTAEDVDDGSFFDLGSYATRCTIPADGCYLLVGNVDFISSSGLKNIYLYKNGAEVMRTSPYYYSAPVIDMLDLEADDYIELYVYHTLGSAMDVTPSLFVVRIS